MLEKGSDNGYIGDKAGFLFLTLVGTSRGLEDVDTGLNASITYTYLLLVYIDNTVTEPNCNER